MKNSKVYANENNAQLKKYRELVLATLDYYIEAKEMHIKTADFDSVEHYKVLKMQAEENFQKGRLTRLKQWFRDLAEWPLETGNLKFNKYLRDKTGYDVDIFKSYFQRIDKIIAKGKITTNNQFYDINSMVDQLCQLEPVDKEKIEVLNKLLGDYERRKSQRAKKHTT